MYNILGALNMDEKTKRDLPIFNELEGWLEIYDGVEDENIKEKRRQFEQILVGQEETKKQLSLLRREKKECMKEILNISDKINNEKGFFDVRALDKEKKRLEKINFNLDDVTYEDEQYQEKIRNANFELLEATLQYSYEEIKKRNKENDIINAEMVEIRDKLKDLYEKRTSNDNWTEKIYIFLHSVLGPNLIEKIEESGMEFDDEDGD